MKLYNIDEEDILRSIERFFITSKRSEGKIELIEKFKSRNNYPLKILFEKNKNIVIVITVYPLKKGKQ